MEFVDGLHRQLAMTRMELVIKDSQMYRPLVLLALIILGINKGKVREFLMVLVLAAMEPVAERQWSWSWRLNGAAGGGRGRSFCRAHPSSCTCSLGRIRAGGGR